MGYQRVYSAGYLEQRHPLEFQKVWKIILRKRIQVCFTAQESLEESFKCTNTIRRKPSTVSGQAY